MPNSTDDGAEESKLLSVYQYQLKGGLQLRVRFTGVGDPRANFITEQRVHECFSRIFA